MANRSRHNPIGTDNLHGSYLGASVSIFRHILHLSSTSWVKLESEIQRIFYTNSNNEVILSKTYKYDKI